jgi:ankyrin repeat protein
MTILHLAAGNGQKDVVKWLLDRGNGSEADNFRRTAQMIAIRNYQNDIFFLLFQQCPRYYKRDYSYNTLLHYAAAYGNMEIVKYLLDVGMAQTMNRKSFYPFEIAILKGHYHCARMLENWTLHFSHHLLNRIAKNPRGTPEYYEIF